MPRNDFTLPSSLPWTAPERVLTCGAEDEAARAIRANTRSESRKLRAVDEDMRISGVALRTPDCKGKDPSMKCKDPSINSRPCARKPLCVLCGFSQRTSRLKHHC